MKQKEILFKSFKIKGKQGLYLCVNTLSDNKLNVKGIHYISINNDGSVNPKEDWNYIGGKDLKKKVVIEDELSGPYFPGATYPIKPLDTHVPDSMDYEIHSAVDDVKNTVGSINDYVRTKLKYSSDKEMADALGAEQVDAVAMAVYNIEEKEQGLIIGDQTGIGKGRVAAAIIRYGALNGFKPIFVTEKPNLFSDMYRDLEDIGSASLVPFIVNSREKKSIIKNSAGEKIYEPPAKNVQTNIIKSGKIPNEYDYVMATYSQFGSEKPTAKQGFLLSASTNNIMVLDESHNAGGDLQTSNSANIFFKSVQSVKGVLFLSATFAKRPVNMPLYATKTAMSEANMTNDELIEAIESGGVALQEVLSSALVAEGQMIRRERTFEGIEVNYITLDENGARDFNVEDKEVEHRAMADRVTGIMRKIIDFQKNYINDHVDKLDDEQKGEQGEVAEREGTKNLGVDNSPYFSKIFNVINQLLFSIKAESVAKRAVSRLKEGKKPVIAFSSTMGTFLEQLEDVKGNPVKVGDKINLDFSVVLKRGLDGVMRITKTNAYGGKEKEVIELYDLSQEAQTKYYELANEIKNTTTGISISPIDVVKQTIEKAGFSVLEVTGRKYEVQDVEGEKSTGILLSRKKESVNDAFRMFNDNDVDVLLINQSGSTGASAHSITTDKVSVDDVKQRVMIMLQAELDINREVQKRGRVNRTGQIYKPIYEYVYSSVPAEKRFAMMLQKKLKSLDANTSSNQKNSEALMKSEDFLNKYGDKIVVDYLKEEENAVLNATLGDPLKLEDTDNTVFGNAAHKVSGRVAVLDTQGQEKFYNDIMERYKNHLEYLISIGDYDLEVENLDLEAETIDKKIAVAGIKGGGSSFAGNTYLKECMVNNLKKPFTKQEVDNQIEQALKGQIAEDIQTNLIAEAKNFIKSRAENDLKNAEGKHDLLLDNITKEKKYQNLKTDEDKKEYINDRAIEIKKSKESAISNIKDRYENNFRFIKKFLDFFYIGRPLIYRHQEIDYKAVFLGFVIDKNKPNPYAPSSIRAKIAIASSLKMISFVLSGEQGQFLSSIIGNTVTNEYSLHDVIENWDDYARASSQDRKKVHIYTDNILQAYSVAGKNGKLVSFTTKSGDIKKGILMPDGWEEPKERGATRTVVPLTTAKRVIMSLTDGSMMTTSNNVSFMRTWKGFRIMTNGISAKKFGWLIKSEEAIKYLTNYSGFEKQSTAWVGDVEVDDLYKVIDIIYNISKATVGLSDAQIEIIKDDLDFEKEEDDKPKVFPKLIELEVKIFRMIEKYEKAFSGLGLAQNTAIAFEKLKAKHPIKSKNDREQLIASMLDEIANITDNFKNPETIGVDKVDVKSLLQRENISPAEWLRRNKTLRRSESDVVEWLAYQIKNFTDTSDSKIDEGKEKLKLKLKLKAKAVKAKMAMLKVK